MGENGSTEMLRDQANPVIDGSVCREIRFDTVSPSDNEIARVGRILADIPPDEWRDISDVGVWSTDSLSRLQSDVLGELQRTHNNANQAVIRGDEAALEDVRNPGFRDIIDRYQDGEIDRDEYFEQMRDSWLEQQGAVTDEIAASMEFATETELNQAMCDELNVERGPGP